MSLLSTLFGRWEVILNGSAKATFQSAFRPDWEESVGITVERHSRTKNERAFIHRIDGSKSKTSVIVAKRLFQGATK